MLTYVEVTFSDKRWRNNKFKCIILFITILLFSVLGFYHLRVLFVKGAWIEYDSFLSRRVCWWLIRFIEKHLEGNEWGINGLVFCLSDTLCTRPDPRLATAHHWTGMRLDTRDVIIASSVLTFIYAVTCKMKKRKIWPVFASFRNAGCDWCRAKGKREPSKCRHRWRNYVSKWPT
jgi:hypothetical protein